LSRSYRPLRWPIGHRGGAHPLSGRKVGAAHEPGQTPAFLRRQIRAAGIQPPVTLHQLWALLLEPLEEHLAYALSQMQSDAGDVGRPGLPRGVEDRLHLLRRVVDPRHERGDEDAGADARAGQLRYRVEPRPRVLAVR